MPDNAASVAKTAAKTSDHEEIVSSASRENADMVVILSLILSVFTLAAIKIKRHYYRSDRRLDPLHAGA